MKTVIEMAREAGFITAGDDCIDHLLKRFAELVRADERKQWEDVENYLIAARDGSMSRNDSEALAGQLLGRIRRARSAAASEQGGIHER